MRRRWSRAARRASSWPSPQAREPQLRPFYESFGLNERQIQIVADAQPKRDYYYQSPLGNRLFELGLGPIALAFVAAGRPEDQRDINHLTAIDYSAAGETQKAVCRAVAAPSRDSTGPPTFWNRFQLKRSDVYEKDTRTVCQCIPGVSHRCRRHTRYSASATSCSIHRISRKTSSPPSARSSRSRTRSSRSRTKPQMLLNDAKNLEHLDFDVVDRLRAKIEMTQVLFNERGRPRLHGG